MNNLQIFLFGKFRVQFDRQTVTGLDTGKTQELLCYLLLHRNRPHPREVLADLLWEDRLPHQAKRYLRKTLWQIQATLDHEAESLTCRMFLNEPGWVQLNPEADLWLDVATFEEAFTLVQGILGRELDADRAQALQAAVDLYRGELLEGCYWDWCNGRFRSS